MLQNKSAALMRTVREGWVRQAHKLPYMGCLMGFGTWKDVRQQRGRVTFVRDGKQMRLLARKRVRFSPRQHSGQTQRLGGRQAENISGMLQTGQPRRWPRGTPHLT